MRSWLLVLAAAGCGSHHRDTIAWSKPVDIAHGGGERGLWQQNQSRYDYVDDPTVTITPKGDTAVAWVNHRDKDVFWQMFGDDGKPRLREPVNLSRSGSVFSWLPRVAVSPTDPTHVYAVWQEIVFSGGTHGGEIFFARSLDGGYSWEAPQNLSTSVAGEGKGRIDEKRWHNGSLDLAVGADGDIYVAWTSYEGDLELRRSRDGGMTFGDKVLVASGTPYPARAPSLAIGNGIIYLAWTVGEDNSADIHLAMSRDGTTFTTPVILERTPGYSDAPKLAVDAGGTLHVAYADSEGGPFDRMEVRYTRSPDGTHFEPARTVSQRRSEGIGLGIGAAFPALAVDGNGVFVTWEHYPRNERIPHGLAIAYSRDGGATFTQPSVIAGTSDRGDNGSLEGRLMRKLAVRDGTIVVVNSAVRHGESSRAWLVRGTVK